MPPKWLCRNCEKEFERKNDIHNPPRFCSRDCTGNGHGHGDAKGKYRTHLIIPDTQVKKDVPMQHLRWLGKYIAHKKPDVVIHLGDHWDMPSLSSYDFGKKSFEGRRYTSDVAAGNEGLDLIMEGVNKMEKKPRLVMLRGNHEDRIMRAVESDSKLDGTIGYFDFNDVKHGWEVHPFREVVDIDGLLYSHFFYNPNTGKPYGGLVSTMIKTIGKSFIAGHRPGLDFAARSLPTGERQIGIIAGKYYQHEEEYLGPQGNNAWSGLVMLHEVSNGQADAMFVSMGYMKRTYDKAEGKPLRK